MSEKMRLENRTAVVTGAASGIGRGIALALAKRGCNLAIADVNDAGLAETTRLAMQLIPMAASAPKVPSNLRVTQHHLDVSNRDAIAAFPAEVLAAHTGVDILVNNAGVALGGTFEQVSEEDFDWLISINLFGVVRMTRVFLPVLHKSDEARLVSISSIFGVITPPGQTAYCASKFAVRGFSNSLRYELRGSTIGVSVVHPGGINTNIARSSRAPQGASPEEVARAKAYAQKALKMPPDRAGEIIVQGIEKREARIFVGSDAKALAFLERLAPVKHWSMVERVIPKP
ncbi:MAG: SDR family NAD(P)-dependent oxidoreductase [Candidatus Acidiferrales bacterium]